MGAIGAGIIILAIVIYQRLQGRNRRIFAWSIAGLLVSFWTVFLGALVLLN